MGHGAAVVCYKGSWVEVHACWAAGVPGVKPVIVELTDFKTKEKVDELEVDAVLVATGRAPYTQVLLPWPAVQS